MEHRRIAWWLVPALLAGALLGVAAPARALDQEQVERAIEKGAKWLRSQQEADGAWRGKYADAYPEGPTALAVYALLKSGAKPNDPQVLAGLDWLRRAPMRRTYSVSCLALALEARSAPTPWEVEQEAKKLKTEDLEEVAQKIIRRRMPPADKELMARAAEFLLGAQKGGLWAYPGYGDPDVSNAQFAIMGLRAAMRAGVSVRREVFVPVAEYYVEQQEKDGPAVERFRVPAADGPVRGHGRSGKKNGGEGGAGEAEVGTEARGGGERERAAMRARGYAYKPGHGPRGSMTAAGIVCLVVAKEALEGDKGYARKLGPEVDRAIRDACAWLAKNLDVHGNPWTKQDWLYYWLYSLERVGALTGCDELGRRDWYVEGAEAILAAQQADGRWSPQYQGEKGGDAIDTAFALLFLTRATSIRLRPVSGHGVGDGAGGGGGGPTVVPAGEGRFDVTFRFRPPGGSPGRVTLAGSFNGWSADACAMARGGDVFEVTIRLAPGRYSYKFVADGAWHPDPGAREREPDGHGGENSVLVVP